MFGRLSFTRLLLALGMIAGLAGASVRHSLAEEFSADLVSLDAGGAAGGLNGKVFVSGPRVRIETADVPGGFFVVDSDRDTAWLLRPSQRVYMEAKQSSRLTQLLVPVDPADPCRKWQAMAKGAGAADQGGEWRCEQRGEEVIDGRDTVKFSTTSPRGQRGDGWIDPKLGFLVRIRAADGTGLALRSFSQGPQPASLFEIPAGYRKFDPLRLIEQIKQSDVWVEPPAQ